jgi:hypothetical protein
MGMIVRLWEKMKKSDQNRIREEAKVMIKRHG